MIPRVDIVIPTWRRPEKLARCIASIEHQTYPNIGIHAIEDTDRLFAFGVWNRFLRTWKGGDCFVYLCDDVELSPGCISAAISDLAQHWPDGDGMVGFHQSICGKDGWSASAMGLVGREFADRFPDRQLFCPDYTRFHADSELGAYARSQRRFSYCQAANLIHYHPAHVKSEMDETHRVVREPGAVAADKVSYEARKAGRLVWGASFERVNP
jgi:hypothetical protein